MARRTRSEVIAQRGTISGCCNAHADMSPCDCLESALPDSTGSSMQLILRLNEAAGLLAVHGVLTDTERARVHARLMKRKKRG